MRVYYLIFPIMVIFLIVISFGLLSYSVYGQENQRSQTNTYENTAEGIKFLYPYWGNLTNEGGCIDRGCDIPLQQVDETTYKFRLLIIRTLDKSSALHPNCDCDTLKEFLRFTYPVIQKAF